MGGWIGSLSLPVQIVLGLAAIALLLVSADKAVKRFVGLARYFKLSATFMGMTVLSVATSIPEISAHLTASGGILAGNLNWEKSSAVVLGANIGSDVVQQTLILGIVVFAAGKLMFERRFLWKNIGPMIATHLLCLVLGLDRIYSRLDGLILFGAFIAYTFYLYRDDRAHNGESLQAEGQEAAGEGESPITRKDAWLYLLGGVAAMAVTIVSATLLLHVTEGVVEHTGIGGSIIGVCTLGIASALPELMTALCGIREKEYGISLGTLIGSNIVNPLVAIGGGALLSTYWVPKPLVAWDLPWEAMTGLILLGMLWFSKGQLGRKNSVYLMVAYFGYIFLRAHFFAVDGYV